MRRRKPSRESAAPSAPAAEPDGVIGKGKGKALGGRCCDAWQALRCTAEGCEKGRPWLRRGARRPRWRATTATCRSADGRWRGGGGRRLVMRSLSCAIAWLEARASSRPSRGAVAGGYRRCRRPSMALRRASGCCRSRSSSQRALARRLRVCSRCVEQAPLWRGDAFCLCYIVGSFHKTYGVRLLHAVR